MLVVGSQSLIEARVPLIDPPKDTDLICTWDEFKDDILKLKPISYYPLSGNKWVAHFVGSHPREYEIAWCGNTAEQLLDILKDTEVSLVDLNYTLKMSHRYLRNSPHFLKTMRHIQLLRFQKAKIPDVLKDWFILREKETYNYPHPKLDTSKSSFFNGDGVEYKYDHDSLHEAIKRSHQPAYLFFKDPNKEVWCDKNLFDEAPTEIKLNAVFEEAAVLALERSLIPFSSWDVEEKVFSYALEKVCTSITSGWFREFAWENYYRVKRIYNDNTNYIKKSFDFGLKNGIIKIYEKSKTNDTKNSNT